jgi:hypothetical protein
MQTQLIELDRGRAATLYRDYKKALYYDKPLDDVDREVMQAYRLIAASRRNAI